jgi:hypothetical protein
MNDFKVKKASGDLVPFDESKLIDSLTRAGASQEIVSEVIEGMEGHYHDGISSRKIYREAYKLLNKIASHHAGRYRLKEAIFELGPSGYPFEYFFGELLRAQGFDVQVGVMFKGKCVNHEIDIIAGNSDSTYIVECKFHSSPGKKSDVKVPLYIQSRFRDVLANMQDFPDYKDKKHISVVVTNTRFTQDAIDYGNCSGMKLISWDYPQDDNLRNRIDRSGLHPITVIHSLKKTEKQHLLNEGIVTCRNLLDNQSFLLDMGVSKSKFNRIISDIEKIIDP